jgi:AsmA protein
LLSGCEISVRRSSARLSGSYQVRGAALIAHFRVTGSQLPVDDVEGVLPALGIHLPGGSRLNSGTVTANIALDGPFDRLVTTGTVQLANAHLAGLDLGSKFSQIPALSGIVTGSDIGIVTLSSGFLISPKNTRISNFNTQLSGIGSLTGDGEIDSGDKLNFRMVAHVTNGGVLRSGLNYVGLNNVPNNIPFLVLGTTSLPIFVPDFGALAKNGAKAAGQQAARQAAQKLLTESTGKSSSPRTATGFFPTAKSGTAPEVSATKKPGLLHKIFGWHHGKKQNDPTELAKK